MALEREDLVELVDLAERQLAELRALRKEAERQTALLDEVCSAKAGAEPAAVAIAFRATRTRFRLDRLLRFARCGSCLGGSCARSLCRSARRRSRAPHRAGHPWRRTRVRGSLRRERDTRRLRRPLRAEMGHGTLRTEERARTAPRTDDRERSRPRGAGNRNHTRRQRQRRKQTLSLSCIPATWLSVASSVVWVAAPLAFEHSAPRRGESAEHRSA